MDGPVLAVTLIRTQLTASSGLTNAEAPLPAFTVTAVVAYAPPPGGPHARSGPASCSGGVGGDLDLERGGGTMAV